MALRVSWIEKDEEGREPVNAYAQSAINQDSLGYVWKEDLSRI